MSERFLKAVLLGVVLSFPGLGCVSTKRYQRDIQLQNANNDALVELAHITVLRLHALEQRLNSLVLSESK